jgi:hypothetical protein
MPTDCMYVYESLPGCICGGLIIVTVSVRVYATVCMDLSLSGSKLEFFLFLFREKENASNLANLFEEERKTGFFLMRMCI